MLILGVGSPHADGGDACAPPLGNQITCENSKPGNPPSEWDIDADGDPSIQGYATDISVNHGNTVNFKVKTDAAAYRIDIYRLGWYGGDGARKVATIVPSAQLPQTQPACLTDATTGLIDCGNWSVSASWNVPADAVSGVYLARPVRTDTGGASHIPFIVRDDGGHENVLYETSDTTWQAYNKYGGVSLYQGNPPIGRAYKVSYNRPFNTREDDAHSWLLGPEFSMLKFLEENGYDMAYTTGVDTARRGSELLNHKVFMTAGHDEYWSGDQRANVEAARDAGVNLAFFTGNDMFWKTRWEDSIDGSGNHFRTLVCYKESQANAKIDPSPEWTGNWRDPRFSPPSDGGRPENELTGQLFQVQFVAGPILVPAAEGKMRFWRNTSVAALQDGQTASLTDGTLGYEWDVVPDNGLRPPGLFYLSTTTMVGQDFDSGDTIPETHHLSLYRAPSGALVFGGGTVYWSYGLETDAYGRGTSDPRMQQAMVNLLADMGSQPGSLEAALAPAAESTDTTPPTTTITSPQPGVELVRGSPLTVTGTATDAGAGRVASVEVSLDGGVTWHPANGLANWTYTGTVGGLGSVNIESRAIDDSGNIENPPTSVTVNPGSCPCSIWSTSYTPATIDSGDNGANEVGLKFRSDVNGYISGVRFYKSSLNTGTHVAHLWTSSGTLLASATFTNETSNGWQSVNFATPVGVAAHATYVVSYSDPNGHFSLDRPYFTMAFDDTPLHALADRASGGNGLFGAAGTFPTSSYRGSNYWVDVLFVLNANDTTPPTVISSIPSDGDDRVPPSAQLRVNFSETMDASTVNSSRLQLRDGSGSLVPASVSYSAASNSATITPADPLADASTYTVTVRGGAGGVTDIGGNALASDYTLTFSTVTPGACPCTFWWSTTIPTNVDWGDTGRYELGVKFQSDTAGYILGIRFYKSGLNTGTHVAHLWNAAGTLLGTATYTNETASGWQKVSFQNPIPITANTTYVASYTDPNGHFSLTRPYFAHGLDNGPLHALVDGANGGNGVYGSPNNFPTSSALASNYWVDPVFNQRDTTPPVVLSVSPAADAPRVAVTSTAQAAFSKAMDASTLNQSTFVLADGNGGSVPGTVSYDAASRTATLTPVSPLTQGVRYTATVRSGASGVKDTSGNALARDYSWSFTTLSPTSCPCSLWSTTVVPATVDSGDASSYEVGMKFRSEVNGYVSGVRFYKSALNTGTHVAHLWTSSGMLLASATFTNETPTGWQEVTFASPVGITANTTYVVSYSDPRGHFATNRPYFTDGFDNTPLHALADVPSGGNGLFGPANSFPTQNYRGSNYWVDLVFVLTANDTTAPTVIATTPNNGDDRVPSSAQLRVNFSETMDASTVTSSSLQLRDSSGAVVPASVSYSSATNSATITPNNPLGNATTYVLNVRGGSGGATDIGGNPLAADYTVSFTTVVPGVCPCTFWWSTTVPDTVDSGASRQELGLKFQSDTAGYIRGVRFYKSALNTGVHVGRLWTSTGALLATATFVNETQSGWQQVNFAMPVAITPNTTYVVSYTAPNGHYSLSRPYFTNQYDNVPLHALASSTSGGNGLYGSINRFPTSSALDSNYWVDTVFAPW